jgi:membrane protein
MSLIPIAALVFALAKGFNYDIELRTFLLDNFSEQQDIIQWILNFVDATLKNTKNGLIAGVGIVMLLWACMKLMVHIEESLNHVWNVKNPRSWKSRITNYLAVLIIAPIFMFVSISFSVTANSALKSLHLSNSFFGEISPFLTFLLKCVPFVSIWILFSLIYKFMPNTRVKYSHALIAGIVAGSAFQLVQNFYVYSQVSITKFSAIYGTFAAIPLFLVWAQISWLIVLIGAELSFAYQNIEHYESEKQAEHTSFMQRKIVALLVARLICINFQNEKKPLLTNEIAEKLSLPTRIVHSIIDNLCDAGIVSEVIGDNEKDFGYQPAFNVNNMTVASVFSRLEELNKSSFVHNNKDYSAISEYLKQISIDFEKSENNKLLIDL